MENKEFKKMSSEFKQNKMQRVLLKKTNLAPATIASIVAKLNLDRQLSVSVVNEAVFKEKAIAKEIRYNRENYEESIISHVKVLYGNVKPGVSKMTDGEEIHSQQAEINGPAAILITQNNNLMDLSIPQEEYELVIMQ